MCTAAVRSEWVFYSKFVLRILLSAVSYVLVGMMGRWLCVCAFLLVACESVRARARKIRLGGWVCVCVGRSFWLSSPPPPPPPLSLASSGGQWQHGGHPKRAGGYVQHNTRLHVRHINQ